MTTEDKIMQRFVMEKQVGVALKSQTSLISDKNLLRILENTIQVCRV